VHGWTQWGDELDSYAPPNHKGYSWATNRGRSSSNPCQLEAAGSHQLHLRLPLE
jgi:hypothetical protein